MAQKTWLGPLTGIAFVVVVMISFIVAGEPPDAEEPAAKIVSHYVDNKDSIVAGALLTIPAVVLLMFFAGTLRQALQRSGPDSMLPGLVLAGATIISVAAGLDSTISMALAERADDVEPAAVQALQSLWDNDFIPFAIGLALFFLSAGLAIVRSRGSERAGALPRWMGWVAIVLGVSGMTPAGFFAFLGGALWIVVASALMMRTARVGPATPAPPPPA